MPGVIGVISHIFLGCKFLLTDRRQLQTPTSSLIVSLTQRLKSGINHFMSLSEGDLYV